MQGNWEKMKRCSLAFRGETCLIFSFLACASERRFFVSSSNVYSVLFLFGWTRVLSGQRLLCATAFGNSYRGG